MPRPAEAAAAPAGHAARAGLALLLLAAVLISTPTAVVYLLRLWSDSPMYSYGYLVPVIAAYLAYATRDRYLARPVQPAPMAGAATFALWAGLVLAGRVSGIILLEQLAIVVAVAGIVLVVWGRAWFGVLWFAVAYLLLMVPIWDGFTERLHLRFQLFSAAIGLRLLEAIGIPAVREGTFISLPNVTLEVARACSGVNYLVAVLALGLPLAYLHLRAPWRRVVLILTAVGIAAVSNGLRVALIGVLAHADIGAPLHGPGHVLHGLFVSGVGIAMLFVTLWLLRESPAGPAPETVDAQPARAAGPAPTYWYRPVLAAIGFVALAAAGLQAYRPTPVPLRAALDDLPLQIGAWRAEPYTQPPAPGWWENADAELRRRYVDGGRAIDVFVVYFERQEHAREVVGYLTNPLHRTARPVPLSTGAGDRVANVASADKDPIVFWYEVDGRIEADPYAAKLETMWRALTRRRTNAAAVFVRAVPGREPLPVDALASFGNALHDALGACLPRPLPPALTAAHAEGVAR